jgi:hypothetical protein
MPPMSAYNLSIDLQWLMVKMLETQCGLDQAQMQAGPSHAIGTGQTAAAVLESECLPAKLR